VVLFLFGSGHRLDCVICGPVVEFEFIQDNYQWILIPFALYCIQMIIAFSKYGKATAFHTYLAKLSAVVQAVFILWLLFFGPVYWLFYLMIVIGIIETLEEILLIFLYPHWVAGVKGYIWAIRDERRKKATDQPIGVGLTAKQMKRKKPINLVEKVQPRP